MAHIVFAKVINKHRKCYLLPFHTDFTYRLLQNLVTGYLGIGTLTLLPEHQNTVKLHFTFRRKPHFVFFFQRTRYVWVEFTLPIVECICWECKVWLGVLVFAEKGLLGNQMVLESFCCFLDAFSKSLPNWWTQMNTHISSCVNMNFEVRECINQCEWSRSTFWELEFDAVSCQTLRLSWVFWMGEQPPGRGILWWSKECYLGTENTMWYPPTWEVNGKWSRTRCCHPVLVNLPCFQCSQKGRHNVFFIANEVSYNQAISHELQKISWCKNFVYWSGNCSRSFRVMQPSFLNICNSPCVAVYGSGSFLSL